MDRFKLSCFKYQLPIKEIRIAIREQFLRVCLTAGFSSRRGTKLYSLTPLPKSKLIPKVVEKNDLSKSVTSHLTTNKIIEKCTKILASGLLKIESKPINAYFKNNRVVHRDYLKVTNEHVGILQELLEQARALKPLDENPDYASKFAERIEELLVFNSDNSYLRDILGDILGKDMHYPFTRFVKPSRVSLVYKRNPTA
ncbi:hypothetical protein Tco_1060164 [Tanacetum coccineum]